MKLAAVLLAIIGTGVASSSCGSTGVPTKAPSEGTTNHLSIDGITVDYPSAWAVNDTGWQTTGFGSPIAFLGTLAWGPCAFEDINCHFEQKLSPDEISVEIDDVALVGGGDLCQYGASRPDLAARGPSDPAASGSLTRVDGRPAILTDYSVGQTDYYNSDEWRTWEIAKPGTTTHAYAVRAEYRGPDLDGLRSQLDQLISSIRFEPGTAGDPGFPTDCGAPFPS